MTDDTQLPEAELAALADGSLPAEREADLRARLAASPELTAAFAAQERAIALTRALDVPAPASLRARVDELTTGTTTGQRRRGPRWRPAVFLPAATALAVVIAALVLVLGGGTSAPTIPQTAHLTLAAANLPVPTESAADADRLNLQVDGVPFPYYGRNEGWAATGARSDSLHGRRILTVFYTAPNGGRVGYAIVSGPPLAVTGGTTVWRNGVRYTLKRTGPVQLITWRRGGHTCVIAGRSARPQTLLALATADASV